MLKKICIINTCNLKYAPYVKLYTDILDNCGCQYDLITWDKCNLKEDVAFAYQGRKNDGKLIRSFFQYIGFGCFLNRILHKNDYRKMIVCNPAPLLFIKNKYLQKYAGRFIWDIRDDTPIRKVFKKRFNKICKLAAYVVTSSNKYEEWIGRETILSHNANKDTILTYYDYEATPRNNSKINIINAGKMIEQDENIRVLEQLGNNRDYNFIYYGTDVPGKIVLKDYCLRKHLDNVEFYGTYDKQEIIRIYRETGDLINILRAPTLVNQNALPNKLYEAVISGIPIVVYEHNTAIYEYVKRYYLGITLNNVNDVIKTSTLLNEFDYKRYNIGRKAFLDYVLNDIDQFESIVKKFIES